jgi:uncharacterized protein YggT (Ycf19 family)
MSWIQLPPSHPIAQLVPTVTEPALSPLRRDLHPMSDLNFSPMVLLIWFKIVKSMLS